MKKFDFSVMSSSFNKITDFLATCDIATLTPEGWIIVDVRDLSDFDKDVEKVKKKILTVTGLIVSGNRVCVRCICGINRSNTIALAALCYLSNKSEYLDTDWDRHYNFMKKIIPKMLIEYDLIKTAWVALHQIYSGWK